MTSELYTNQHKTRSTHNTQLPVACQGERTNKPSDRTSHGSLGTSREVVEGVKVNYLPISPCATPQTKTGGSSKVTFDCVVFTFLAFLHTLTSCREKIIPTGPVAYNSQLPHSFRLCDPRSLRVDGPGVGHHTGLVVYL